MPSIAIIGSVRKQKSKTGTITKRLIAGYSCDIIDLKACAVAPYNHEQEYPDEDEFISVVHQIVYAPLTIIATPVHWYSYSTRMKTFIDRFFDLRRSQYKELGDQLKGRNFALVSSSTEPGPDPTLVEAFSRFCEYFGIHYVGCAHAASGGDFCDAEAVARIQGYLTKESVEMPGAF